MPKLKKDELIETEKLNQLKNQLLAATCLNETQIDLFLDAETVAAQRLLATHLRRVAIHHLRTAKEVTARAFRGEFSAVPDMGVCDEFLTRQGKEGAWATYLEATALGEKFGCNVVVTYQRAGKDDSTWCLYRAAGDAPTVHLYNKSNSHWFVDSKTVGEGNCLYNAFAQAMQTLLKKTRPVKKSETAPVVQRGLFKPIVVIDDVVKSQANAIKHVIEKHPTPEQLRTDLEKQHHEEASRLSRLGLDERKKIEKQIREDHALALRLAREEMIHPSYVPARAKK
jgi:hypothetical protein